MIVQPREDRLRLIRQHDHALAAGELAHAWRPPGGPLPFRLVTAVGLHDLAWRPLDRRPRRDPATGRPFDFQGYPLGPKLRAYTGGLDEMEAVDPWVGLLGSLHYASFLDEEQAPEFLASERERRARLCERAGSTEAGKGLEARAERHLRWLKFFDGLSLRLCLSPPAVPDDVLPPWLDRGAPVTPPAGGAFVPSWREDGAVVAAGDALPEAVTLTLPVRDLPARRYRDDEALARAWRDATERTWRLEVVPGG